MRRAGAVSLRRHEVHGDDGGRRGTGWQGRLLTLGLATIALAGPGEMLIVGGVLFGVHLLAASVFQLAAAFGAKVPRRLRILHFVTGAASVLLGLIRFRGTRESIFLLALWSGFGRLMLGTLETVAVAFGIPGTMAGSVTDRRP